MGLQLSRLERTPDKREVVGSSPLKPTKEEPRFTAIAVSYTHLDVYKRQLMQGAATAQKEFDNDDLKTNDCYKYAAIRNELKRHNSMLADAAHDAGVVEQRDYAIFQNYRCV